jgi:hypothetical protein
VYIFVCFWAELIVRMTEGCDWAVVIMVVKTVVTGVAFITWAVVSIGTIVVGTTVLIASFGADPLDPTHPENQSRRTNNADITIASFFIMEKI